VTHHPGPGARLPDGRYRVAQLRRSVAGAKRATRGRWVRLRGGNRESRCQTLAVELAPSRPEDRPALKVFLRDHNSLRVARRAELVDALDHPAVLAWSEGRLVGAATYAIDGDACEVLTLHAGVRFTGTGSALLAALKEVARDAGCRRLWVVTTNDNVDALRFYQRRGFRLTALRCGAVDQARLTLKPQIPVTGDYGIPIRDEIELAQDLPLPTTI
jgi:GNAT superfamily N-acetyltransferase